MSRLYLDFETYSASDLKDEGAHKYSKHPSTGILCVGYALDDEPVVVCFPEDLHNSAMMYHVKKGGTVVAHNAPFELAIWNNVGVKWHGWPKLLPSQVVCTMARAYAMSLPGSLDGVSAALGIEQQKDMAGHRLMMKMSQPRRTEKCFLCHGSGLDGNGDPCESANDEKSYCDGNSYTWWREPEQFERLFKYCATDIEVDREVDKRLLQLTEKEKRVWLLDQEINNRGVYVDTGAASKAILVVEQEQKRLNSELQFVSNNRISTYNANGQFKQYLTEEGFPVEGVAKAHVTELLAKELPAHVRRALEIRQEAARSSTAKLKKMISGACDDSRLRGLFQYYGANTGRWGGRRTQPHNFPKPTIEQPAIEELFDVLHTMPATTAAQWMEMFHASRMSTVANCLRGFLCAPPYRTLVAADWSAIEARKLAWLAGEERVLDIFRTHGKIYEEEAASIFGVRREQVTKVQRPIGKVSTLALGFGGGVGAFQAMARGYGVQMAPAFEALWARADTETKDRAMARWSSARLDEQSIGKQEFLASELTKLLWRKGNPNIVRYWADVETAAKAAIQFPGTEHHAPHVTFKMVGSFLFCRLPSGRVLTYPYPKLKKKKTPWGQERVMMTYKSQDPLTHKWGEVSTYGGSLVENITQGSSRDVLVDAMLRVDADGWPIVLHVHDEIVAETEDRKLAHFLDLVAVVPDWAKGLPIAVEGWQGKRYRK